MSVKLAGRSSREIGGLFWEEGCGFDCFGPLVELKTLPECLFSVILMAVLPEGWKIFIKDGNFGQEKMRMMSGKDSCGRPIIIII